MPDQDPPTMLHRAEGKAKALSMKFIKVLWEVFRGSVAIGIFIVVVAWVLHTSIGDLFENAERADNFRRLVVATAIFAITAIVCRLLFEQLKKEEAAKAESPKKDLSVSGRLFDESLAMAEYALSKGLDVSDTALKSIIDAQAVLAQAAHEAQVHRTDNLKSAAASSSSHILSMPTTTMPVDKAMALAVARRHLVDLVAPATPSTLQLLRSGKLSSFFAPLGRVRLIRHMLYVAVVFLMGALALVVFADPLASASPGPETSEVAPDGQTTPTPEESGEVACSDESATGEEPAPEPESSPQQNPESETSGIGEEEEQEDADDAALADEPVPVDTTVEVIECPPNLSVGEQLLGTTAVERLWNTLFLISVAGLGAAFYALYTATRYIKNNSYDQQYEPTYWIRFVLGLVGGFALALLISNEFLDETKIGIPLLAFAGGFSADVVHRILQRIVDTIDTLVRGSGKDRFESQQRAAQARASNEIAEARLRLGNSLARLETQLGVVSDADIRAEIRSLINDVLPFPATFTATTLPGEQEQPNEGDETNNPPGADASTPPDPGTG